MKKILISSIIFAVSGFVSTEAMAQISQDGDPPPKCDTLPECKKALQDCSNSAGELQKKLDVCEEKLKALVPAAVPKKPAKLVCEGPGIRETASGGCECVEADGQGGLKVSTEALLVTGRNAGVRVCAAPYEALRKLAIRVKAHDELISALQKRVDRLDALLKDFDFDAFKKEYALVIEELVDHEQRIKNLEAWMAEAKAMLQDHEDRIVALEGLIQSPWTTGAEVSVGGLFLPGAGPVGVAELKWTNTVYFDKTTPLGLTVKAGAGRGFGNESLGGLWLLDAELDLTFNAYRRVVEIDLGITGKQCISDHGAGYQGVLEDPGICTFVGGAAGLRLNLVKFLNLGVSGAAGYSNTNYFAGPGELRLSSGVAGYVGANIGVHTSVF